MLNNAIHNQQQSRRAAKPETNRLQGSEAGKTYIPTQVKVSIACRRKRPPSKEASSDRRIGDVARAEHAIVKVQVEIPLITYDCESGAAPRRKAVISNI